MKIKSSKKIRRRYEIVLISWNKCLNLYDAWRIDVPIPVYPYVWSHCTHCGRKYIRPINWELYHFNQSELYFSFIPNYFAAPKRVAFSMALSVNQINVGLQAKTFQFWSKLLPNYTTHKIFFLHDVRLLIGKKNKFSATVTAKTTYSRMSLFVVFYSFKNQIRNLSILLELC